LGSGRSGAQASGGYGRSDDTYDSSGRSGAGFGDDSTRARQDDFDSSGRTGGGLGTDDTYGDSTRTGGIGTGRDDNYGVGSGRTGQQERGGYGGGGDSYDDNEGGGGKKDSTTGKLLEKAGGLFKSNKLEERGAEKRREAGSGDY
jgi:hypothetical protein